MEWKDALRAAIQEWVLPEFDKLRLENAEIRSTLQLTNRRLDDMQLQLVDLSRRLDETNKRIDETNKRIDEINKRIDETNKRIDETNQRIDRVHADLLGRIDKVHADLIGRIDETHKRIDRLYEVIVRRDEHIGLERWVRELDRKVLALEGRLPA
jgi:uncharacterized coiled-coil DUF342 family protein